MDKQKISIKINGQERSFLEATSELDEGSMEQTVNEEIAAARSEEKEEEFEWILPQYEQQLDKSNQVYESIVDIEQLRKKQSERDHWIGAVRIPTSKRKRAWSIPKTFFLAILSALVIGTGFGMMVLQVFTGDKMEQAYVSNTTPKQVQTPPNTELPVQGESDKPESSIVPITVPALSVYVVQGGVFSSKEAAEPVKTKIQESGLASTLTEQEGKHYLFMGVGLTDEASRLMREPYAKYGYETYVKLLTLEPKQVEANPILLDTKKLFELLIQFSSNQYASVTHTTKWEDIEMLYTKIQAEEGISGKSLAFHNAVLQAYIKVKAYKETLSEENFWTVQQGLLDSFSYYQNWISE